MKNIARQEHPLDFSHLYNTCYEQCFALVFRMLQSKETAEDIVQDVFLKFWCLQDKSDDIEEPISYLFRMTRNASITYLRKEQNSRKLLQSLNETLPKIQYLTESIVAKRELDMLWQHAIRKLPPQRKKVYVLSQIESWQVEKIANFLGLAVPTIKETLKQAKHQVRDYISARTGIAYSRRSMYSKTSYLLPSKSFEAA